MEVGVGSRPNVRDSGRASEHAVSRSQFHAGRLANGPATIYDKALDAEYLATNIGGGNHRLFDGGHTIAGAFKAVQGASTEDSVIQEGFGFVQGMFRDVTTSKGLPLANWDKATYDHAASFLETRFQLSREWFYDLNSYTAAELVGGTIGILAVVFQWNRADTESFSRMVGSMGVAAVLSANPLLLVITVVAVARAFQRARTNGKLGDLVDGSVRGSVVATLAIFAVAQVTTIGGPVGLSLLGGPRGRHPRQQGRVSRQRCRYQPSSCGTG